MAVTFLPFVFPGLAGVRCAFQTRQGGFSQGAYGGGNISFATKDAKDAVAANRRSLRECLGVPTAELSQVHGDGLIFEPEAVPAEGLPVEEADGHATSRRGLGLIIKTADCQPILVAHESGRCIMALHCGWRGNRINFPASAVARFCEHYGVKPRELMAVRGPSLGPGMAEFVNFGSEWGQDFAQWFSQQEQTMDLWSLTRHQLITAGLLPSRVYGLDLCTASMNDMFFSYRKEKESGRQASVIWME